MIAEFWELVVQIVTGFLSALTSAFNGIVDLFYQAEGGFTVIGQLLLVALGMGIVYFAFRFIRSLIKNRG